MERLISAGKMDRNRNVKRLVTALSLIVLWPLAILQAQTYPPNDAGVSFGQWHTIVRDIEASKKWWMTLGGIPIKIDGVDIMKFPGVFVFLTQGTPTGGTEGSPISHVGFGAQNVPSLVEKLKAGGWKVFRTNKSHLNGQDVAHLYTTDDLAVELTTEAGVPPYPRLPPGKAIESNHLQFEVGPGTGKTQEDMEEWYVKMFGAKPTVKNEGLTAGFPGMLFTAYGSSKKQLVPTKGRALDYIGLEVKNLESYCKKLEAKGVKFDEPFSKTRHKSFASAELTDPFGVSIELTEGLNRF